MLHCSHNISDWNNKKTLCVALLLLKSSRCYHSPGCSQTKNASSLFFSSVVRLLSGVHLRVRVCACLTVAFSASGLNGILHKRIWAPLKLWQVTTQIKIDWTVPDKSLFERVFFWKHQSGHSRDMCCISRLQQTPRWPHRRTDGHQAPHLMTSFTVWTRLPILCVLACPWVSGWTESHREHGVHPRLT